QANVVTDQFEAPLVQQWEHVVAAPGAEVVHAHDLGAVPEQPRAQMRAEEARSTGDENASTVESLHGLSALPRTPVGESPARLVTRPMRDDGDTVRRVDAASHRVFGPHRRQGFHISAL